MVRSVAKNSKGKHYKFMQTFSGKIGDFMLVMLQSCKFIFVVMSWPC